MMLVDKIKWIIKKQKEYEHIQKDIIKPTFLPDSTLPYLGKNYPIKLVPNTLGNEKTKTFELVNEYSFFLIVLDTHKNEKSEEKISDVIKGLYTKWLEKQARKILKAKISKYSKTIQVNPSRFVIKKFKK